MTYNLHEFQERIGYTFQDEKLLKQALTHSSFTNEQRINQVGDYERLEFLGDAVLELVSSNFLYHKYKKLSEGELTRLRASIVCEPSLAFCAGDLELGEFIRLGKGEEASGGRSRDSIVSDVMEAVIGAIFLDGGIEPAQKHIERFVLNDLENKVLFSDSKSRLQELIQGQLKKDFSYELIDESGPEHNRIFTVRVLLEKEEIGKGSGKNKKAAEQQAAYQALLLLKDRGYVLKKY